MDEQRDRTDNRTFSDTLPIMSQTARLTPLLLLCLLVTYVVWGTTYFAISVALRAMPPFMLMASRFAVADLCLGLFVLVRGRARASWRQVRNGSMLGAPLVAWLYLVTMGSLLAFSAYIYLASHTTAVLATSYVYANPPIALLVGAALGGERIAPQTLVAIALILCALAVLSWGMWRQPTTP